jgi:hypothetical protein
MDRLPPVVGRGWFLPGLCHRPGHAALAGRLRPPAHGAGGVADPAKACAELSARHIALNAKSLSLADLASVDPFDSTIVMASPA